MNYIIIKLIALFTMLIDHIGGTIVLNEEYRAIGRLSFPLFAFLLINGFNHTTNKYKYLLRLGMFALISEIPYNLAFSKSLINTEGLNIFFTLFNGLLLIIICEKIKNKINNVWLIISQYCLASMFMVLNYIIKADYGPFGILLIFLLYKTYGTSIKAKIKMSISLIVFALSYLIAISNAEMLAIVDIIFIFMFEDKKVNVNKIIKILMYVFYPVHLLILYLIELF